jgi:hypothetical protein
MADTSTDAIQQSRGHIRRKTVPELTLLTFSRPIPARMADE